MDNFRLSKRNDSTITYFSDINKDGRVDVNDVVALVNILLNKNLDQYDLDAADVDRNDERNLADVTALVNWLQK